jgi:uridylate kinase
MARIVLKMSGEAIADIRGRNMISPERLQMLAHQITAALMADRGSQLAIVVGAGNIARGKSLQEEGLDRITADYMGMLATVINALPLRDFMEAHGVQCRVLSGFDIGEVAEPYIRNRAIRHLEKGRVLICAAGLGRPFLTTDAAAALRACELQADILLCAKSGTDAVYDRDPQKDADAISYRQINYDDFLGWNLQVMDGEAATLCRSNHIPIYLFGIEREEGLLKALLGERDVGTYIGACATITRESGQGVQK